MLRRMVSFVVLLLLAASVWLGPGAANAFAPCVARAPADVTLAFPERPGPTIGTGLECRPDTECFGCFMKIRGTVKAYGVVAIDIWAAGTTPVSCGPALNNCSVETAAFPVPIGGSFVRCRATIMAAVDVELGCVPIIQ